MVEGAAAVGSLEQLTFFFSNPSWFCRPHTKLGLVHFRDAVVPPRPWSFPGLLSRRRQNSPPTSPRACWSPSCAIVAAISLFREVTPYSEVSKYHICAFCRKRYAVNLSQKFHLCRLYLKVQSFSPLHKIHENRWELEIISNLKVWQYLKALVLRPQNEVHTLERLIYQAVYQLFVLPFVTREYHLKKTLGFGESFEESAYWALLSFFAMIQTCTFLFSRNFQVTTLHISTCEISKESIVKFLRGNRFHVTLYKAGA